jgi:hypothetical protein
MRFGHKMYYGAEMLVYIYKINWNNEYTKELCKNILRTIKTKDILNCHSPILTCLLLCEFLTVIMEISVLYRSLCDNVKNQLMQFCHNIQEANPDENYIKFLMTQKDSRGRTGLQIASENSFYHVLETAEIGIIVNKMWNGKVSNNGFFAPCSMHRYINNESKSTDPFNSFDTLDSTKVYFYQLDVWLSSCSLRYHPESLSTILLIVIYNVYIWMLVSRGQMMNSIYEMDNDLKILLYIYIIWVICININIFNVMIFTLKTGRKFRTDAWLYLEIVMLFSALALLLDIKNLIGFYESSGMSQIIGSLQEIAIPIAKQLKIQADFAGSAAYLLQAFILAFNDILVWLRITGILLTFKDMGPLIRMIYLMTILLLKNLVIYALYITCCAAIFTAIFHAHAKQFTDFSSTIISLFGSFVNNFDANGFDDIKENKSEFEYFWFGAIMIIAYNSVSAVLMINLLIAILSDVYESMALLVDASHRGVLISYFRKYKWDEKYGYLIFLTTPLSIINFIFLPFSLCFKDKKLFNRYCCMICYGAFYFPFIFSIYTIYSMVLIPFCYIKGITFMIKHQMSLKYNRILKTINVLKWILSGGFYLLYIYFRDLFYVLKTVFNRVNAAVTETNRFKKFITKDEVIIFLKFIHSQSNEPQDLHSLFMNYLVFEQREKAEKNEKLKEKSLYMDKIHASKTNVVPDKKGRRKSRAFAGTSTVVIHNNISNNLENTISSNYIKKNLIIIEILENFLMDQGNNSPILDMEKLKMLLPKTVNINSDYIKRLVYTDVNSLNKAVNKLKMKKYVFLQSQLLNKILTTAIKLDKEIDLAISKKYKNLLRTSGKDNKIDEVPDAETYKEMMKIVDGFNEEVKELYEYKQNKIKMHNEKKTPGRKSRVGTERSMMSIISAGIPIPLNQ